MNPHGPKPTWPSTMRVCQFRHPGFSKRAFMVSRRLYAVNTNGDNPKCNHYKYIDDANLNHR